MTERSGQASMADLQEVMPFLLQLWQLPIAIGSHWLDLMLEITAMMPPRPHVVPRQPHDQLIVPPEIEVESEQCLFA